MVYDTNTCVRAGVRVQKRIAPSMVYDTNTCVRAGGVQTKTGRISSTRGETDAACCMMLPPGAYGKTAIVRVRRRC